MPLDCPAKSSGYKHCPVLSARLDMTRAIPCRIWKGNRGTTFQESVSICGFTRNGAIIFYEILRYRPNMRVNPDKSPEGVVPAGVVFAGESETMYLTFLFYKIRMPGRVRVVTARSK